MEQNIQLAVYMMLFGFLGTAAYFDLRWKRIPRSVLAAGTIFALVCMLIQQKEIGWEFLWTVFPGIVLLFIAWGTRESIGYGDGISVLILGGMMGLRNCIWVLCISLLLLSLSGLFLYVLKKVNRKTKLPYVPFLFAAESISIALHVF